jgi:hypothetical protein
MIDYTGLNSFHRCGLVVPYKDPVVCNEMLQIICELEMKTVARLLTSHFFHTI